MDVAVYVFRCQGCRHEFSVMTAWSKKGDVVCPQCGGSQLDEQFGQYRIAAVGGGGGEEPMAGGACRCFPDGGGCGMTNLDF